MKILVINGPNLNFLGIREKNIYGNKTYLDLIHELVKYAKEKKIKIEFKQSNSEGEIIDYIQEAYLKKMDGIIINPGAYSHYSYAIYDCLKSVDIDTVEVHLTDVSKREEFRKKLVTAEACKKVIIGKGFDGYFEAVDYFLK